MAILIKPDMTQREVMPANGISFSLPELRHFIGDDIQSMRTEHGSLLIVAENGKTKAFPLNMLATAMMIHLIQRNDAIVGNALVCDDSEVE